MAFISQTTPLTTVFIGSLSARWVTGVAAFLRSVVARQQTRVSLGGLSEKELRDIGLTRHDAFPLGGGLPLAGRAPDLAELRRTRAGNW